MKHLWIINHYSSTTLFYHSYAAFDLDPNLVSGLLTAFNSFSEVELKSKGISAIEMAGFRWIYLRKKEETGLLLVATADFDIEAEIIRSRLEIIHNSFMDKYKLKKETIENDAINLKKFESFHDKLLELEDQWNQAELMLSSAMMYDMLGVFQQILNRIHKILPNMMSYAKNEDLKQEILKMTERLKYSQIMQECPGLSDIKYDLKEGWTILNVNPMMMDGEILIDALTQLLINLKRLLLEFIEPEKLTYNLNRFLLPYILTEFSLFLKLNIVKKILHHLFIFD